MEHNTFLPGDLVKAIIFTECHVSCVKMIEGFACRLEILEFIGSIVIAVPRACRYFHPELILMTTQGKLVYVCASKFMLL